MYRIELPSGVFWVIWEVVSTCPWFWLVVDRECGRRETRMVCQRWRGTGIEGNGESGGRDDNEEWRG